MSVPRRPPTGHCSTNASWRCATMNPVYVSGGAARLLSMAYSFLSFRAKLPVLLITHSSDSHVLRGIGVRVYKLGQENQPPQALHVLLHHWILVILKQIILLCDVDPGTLVGPTSSTVARKRVVPLLAPQYHVHVSLSCVRVLALGGQAYHLAKLLHNSRVGLASVKQAHQRLHGSLHLLERLFILEDVNALIVLTPSVISTFQQSPPSPDREAHEMSHEGPRLLILGLNHLPR
mmetsp:Transcript_76332/g.223820  ORF Transcript_76332/g.223820 Transcript_76332/m.223820 type:complete len:234 (-) Transcript_76332:340-1041(-)